MSKNKKILLWVSAILMIVSGITVGALCLVAIVEPAKLTELAKQATLSNPDQLEATENLYHWLVSLFTAGSVVGVIFGGISIKFCTYSSIEFYQKQSVVLTVAIICTIIVNPLVGVLYIVAVCMKDKNLNLEGAVKEEPQVDVDQVMQKIEKLQRMRDQNLINDDEFVKLKYDILSKAGLGDVAATAQPAKTEVKAQSNEINEAMQIDDNK